jgi:hypothetical protein
MLLLGDEDDGKEYYDTPATPLEQCACEADWTDGTGWCEQCGFERVRP